LSAAGYALSLTNYWPIINGSYTDYVGGKSLTPNGVITLSADRLNSDSSGCFRVTNTPTSYASAPGGYYFTSMSFTITMWLNPLGGGGIFDFSNSGSYHLHLNYNGGQAFFEMYHPDGSQPRTGYLTTAQLPYNNTWSHVAITYSLATNTTLFYVNGNVGANNTGGMGSFDNVSRSDIWFGKNAWGGAADAKFDEIKFHARVLSAQEILNDKTY
jgi:hypothetical protein